ncbi:MAG: BrnT family toxin [Nitrospinota bacterium]
MDDLISLETIDGFDWDDGNKGKNERHGVFDMECEQVFFNEALIYPDLGHSHSENRYHALGRTISDRFLHITFTVRKNKIRVISARKMTPKERRKYHVG